MRMHDPRDALPRERLLPEAALDIVQDAGVGGVGLIQEVLECKVRLAKPVTEALRQDPATVRGGSSVCIPHN